MILRQMNCSHVPKANGIRKCAHRCTHGAPRCPREVVCPAGLERNGKTTENDAIHASCGSDTGAGYTHPRQTHTSAPPQGPIPCLRTCMPGHPDMWQQVAEQ